MKFEAIEQIKRLIIEGRVSRDEVVRQLYVELHSDNSSSNHGQKTAFTAPSVQQTERVQERPVDVSVANIAEKPAKTQEEVIAQAKAAAKAKSDQEREVEAAAARLREKHDNTYASRPRESEPVFETAGLSEIEKHVKGMTKRVIESEIPLIQNHWAPELTILGEKINREAYLELLIREARNK